MTHRHDLVHIEGTDPPQYNNVVREVIAYVKEPNYVQDNGYEQFMSFLDILEHGENKFNLVEQISMFQRLWRMPNEY